MKKLSFIVTLLLFFALSSSSAYAYPPTTVCCTYGELPVTISNFTYDPLTHNVTFDTSAPLNYTSPFQLVFFHSPSPDYIGSQGELGDRMGEYGQSVDFNNTHFELDLTGTDSGGTYNMSSFTDNVYFVANNAAGDFIEYYTNRFTINSSSPTPTIAPTSSPTPTVTPTPAPILPTNKEQCKKGLWGNFIDIIFKNQGSCVSFVVTS